MISGMAAPATPLAGARLDFSSWVERGFDLLFGFYLIITIVSSEWVGVRREPEDSALRSTVADGALLLLSPWPGLPRASCLTGYSSGCDAGVG